MAATMTQIQQTPEDAQSVSILKLGSPGNPQSNEDELTAAATVFKISPETALQHLCTNVERLKSHFAEQEKENGKATGPNSFCSTPIGSETADEDLAKGVSVGLHVAEDPNHTERTKEETFQMAILSRKFLSKKIPPISLNDYLLRLHRYCPMSTAVFLATSVYITRMTLIEKLFRVTAKNMHRLVLAGLLVAIKALEDLGFPHTRIAKVGGVSEQELSKLEISFAFLADFDLKVDARMLMGEIHDESTTQELSI